MRLWAGWRSARTARAVRVDMTVERPLNTAAGLGVTEIGASENDAGAHDPDANLTGARHRQHEDLGVRASSRAKRVGGDDRCMSPVMRWSLHLGSLGGTGDPHPCDV